ncbi:MAG: hypothetical protein Dasosvirus1_27 [Dasosvirus sp.]|uniref:Uncharacterized protein n=1 Tax=Dasosvirus sp. TaxID=2487764 RepID=A0A3G4ZR56_9VIRU|nr:MAG: hypothetical protein Dasosvirus1_27 [Dasosvirus sp.]
MNFRFKFYKTDKFIAKNLIEKYSEQYAKLIKLCFNYDTDNGLLGRLIYRYDSVLFAYDANDKNKNLLGFVFVGYDDVVKVTDPIETYVLTKNTVTEHVRSKIFPVIGSFCRKKGDMYKGLGEKMLIKLIQIYRDKGEKYLYTIPESTVGLSEHNKTDNLCGIGAYGYNNRENDYYRNNQKLIEYYQSIGFKILNNTYYIDPCNVKDVVIYNIMYIDL